MRCGTAAVIGSFLWIGVTGCPESNPAAGLEDGLGAAGAGAEAGQQSADSAAQSTSLNQGSQLANVSRFPGTGTGNAGAALPAGDVCDAVVKTTQHALTTPATRCLMAIGSEYLAASLEQVLECVEGTDTVHVRLTFDPGFVDNTFGTGSIGWPHKRGHTMDKDLIRSDHAEITATNGDGDAVVRFKLDYISPDPSAPSGFGSLGVRGGDGKMLVGDPSWIVQWNTSLSRNFNERGYATYTVDSPSTDDQYTPNPDAPEWDFRVVYEAWIDIAAFGDAGFGDASISFVHASPSKGSDDTLHVEPGDCPPPFCQPDDPKCAGTGGSGGSGPMCQPDDPNCVGSGGSGGAGGSSAGCGPDDPECVGSGGTGGSSTDCGPDDPACVGSGGMGGSAADCGPDDPACTGQGGLGGTGGSEDPTDCAPDDPECFGTGTVGEPPPPPPPPACPPEWPFCSPD